MSGEKNEYGIFHKAVRTLRAILILALIIVPCGYAAKLGQSLHRATERIDSLNLALECSKAMVDSMKIIQDNEILNRDSLEDMVDKKLEEESSEAMIVIDTTQDWMTARKAIEEKTNLDGWIDSLCAPYPEGVAAHVKLHYIESRAIRLERLNHRYESKFQDQQQDQQ